MTNNKIPIDKHLRNGRIVVSHGRKQRLSTPQKKQLSPHSVKPNDLRSAKENLEKAIMGSVQTMDALFRSDPRKFAPILALDFGDGKRHKNNYWHSLQVASQTPARLNVRLAGLLHDVGKADTFAMLPDGNGKKKATFHNHEMVGKNIAIKFLRDLGFDKRTVWEVSHLVYHSGRIKDCEPGNTSDAVVRRIMADVGENLMEDYLCLFQADVTSKHKSNHVKVKFQTDAFRERMIEVEAKDLHNSFRPVLDGNDVMSLTGLKPGRELGTVVKKLTSWNRDNPDASVSEAQKFLESLS